MIPADDTPVYGEEDQKTASRETGDNTLGPLPDDNKDAGEIDAVQQAYDASVPSYELNLDAGEFAGEQGKADEDAEDSNIKQ